MNRLVLPLLLLAPLARAVVVEEVTRLYPVEVERVVRPRTVEEVQVLVRRHPGPVSVGGGRYSMGGQTAAPGVLQLDMRGMDRVLSVSPDAMTVEAEAGATWRKLQEALDPHGLSLKIMQSYANFTVGGSLSVNVHGRYVNQGPLIRATRSIKVVLPDGRLVEADRRRNAEVFHAAIGGYGGVGIIVSAVLEVERNEPLERASEGMALADYPAWFARNIRGSKTAVFHNADIYPPDYGRVMATTFSRTDKPVTVKDRLQPRGGKHLFTRIMQFWLTKRDYAKRLREKALDPARLKARPVVWRNYEASYDVAELEPPSRKESTYVLQEYFIPVSRFSDFVPRMAEVFRRHKVNVINVSIRHALPDTGSLLSWAPDERFAFVVYYEQGTSRHERTRVGIWTRELVDAALAAKGSYYLPYQWHPRDDQFHAAYPRAKAWFALKKRLDPSYRFRNSLWDRYFPPPAEPAAATAARERLARRPDWRRPEEQSLLTLPEWFIVYSAEERASHLLAGRSPGSFRYRASVRQFWSMRRAVNRVLKGRYPANTGYQAMIGFIGACFAVEYGLQGLYEKTVGALALKFSAPGAADAAAAKAAADYAAFLHDTPWYDFPFFAARRDFLAAAAGGGLRGLERRLAVGAELALKGVWAKAVKALTGAAYAPEDLTIRAWVTGPKAAVPGVRTLEEFGAAGRLIELPRYRGFQQASTALARAGVRFVEIAGNRRILVTVIAPKAWRGERLWGEPVGRWRVLTRPGMRRAAILLPVASLSAAVNELPLEGVTLEHAYDY
ncbi:MAG: FAD-binding oxidoreductase [Elusimicrobiota bacterium]|nr:FAD-binding oxidoreductase [Elusimicrobiota bacterium]